MIVQIDSKCGKFLQDQQRTIFWSHTNKPNLPAEVLICEFQTSTGGKPFKEAQLYLYGQLLYKHRVQKWKVSIIADSFLETIVHPVLGSGMRISINSLTFEFFGQVEHWRSPLMKLCIQSNFTQKYSILKLLGQGTYGKVYLAKNKIDHINVAVKTFEKQLLTTPNDKKSLHKELEITRMFTHPHLLSMIETFESEQFIFVVFEYLEGGNLKQQIKKLIQEKKAFQAIKCILLGLEHMHKYGIIHRDIKPQNIMLRKKNNLQEMVIVDFGLADKYRQDGQYLFTNCGTTGYCAPEVLQNKHYDYKVDIYSTGIVLYQMLVGQGPFHSDDKQIRKQQNIQGLIDWSVLNLSEEGLDFLQQLLSRNPQYRVTATQALNHQYFHHQELQSKQLSPLSNVFLSSGSQISSPASIEYQKFINPLFSPNISPKSKNFSLHHNKDNDELDNLIQDQVLKNKSITHDLQFLATKPKFNFKIKHRNSRSAAEQFFIE